MKKLSLGGLSILFAVLVSAGLTLLGVTEGWGQQKTKVSYKWTAAEAKYTKQYSIDVSAHHQIRIFELHRTFPKDPPVFEGVKVKEDWERGNSDYVDLNGRWGAYGEFVMENGDRIYYRLDGISQTTTNQKGNGKSIATAVAHLEGGTGKFSAIRGTLRYELFFDPKKNINEGRVEGEYWMEK